MEGFQYMFKAVVVFNARISFVMMNVHVEISPSVVTLAREYPNCKTYKQSSVSLFFSLTQSLQATNLSVSV